MRVNIAFLLRIPTAVSPLLESHFHIFCSPIPDLQNGIGFIPLSRGETKRTKKERDPFYAARSNRARSTHALGQAVSSYSLKRGVYLVQI